MANDCVNRSSNVNNPITPWRPTAQLHQLELRARLIQSLRSFFLSRQILEIETPLLSHYATTEVHLQSFTVHESASSKPSGYLRTSPEMAMKRLLAAGSGSIYQIAKAFRVGERGARHNPEFTLLEWYRVQTDYAAFIAENIELIESVLQPHLALQPAQQIRYRDAFLHYAQVDPMQDSVARLREVFCTSHDISSMTIAMEDRDTWLDLLLTHRVEPALPRDRLVVIRDYPASQAALARLCPNDPACAERFEIYLNGIELANGFHELSDATEQAARIEQEIQQRKKLGLVAVRADPHFLAALQHGLPDCCGVAIGVDRLVMLAAGVTTIDEVLSFPYEWA